MSQEQDALQFDVVIIGAGPAGLATAIKLAQLAKVKQTHLEICVLEKAAAIGSQILAGAVIEPDALRELIPDCINMGAPLNTKVSADHFWLLSKNHKITLPVPPQMHNHGNYIISLSELCRWLGTQAEALGIQIFPGFAATDALYNDQGQVIGIVTGEHGLSKNTEKGNAYQPGIKIYAHYTVLAEGARGSLTKIIEAKYGLRTECDPQTYALGIKELWEILPQKHVSGKVVHTIGWPLDNATYGGSFMYHFGNNLLSLGFAVGLDYRNPYLNPFAEMQRFKHHPAIKSVLEGGRCVEYGARVITEGGYQSLAKLDFPGGLIVGCAAGLVNVPRIKGIHNALRSGMLAAECIMNNWVDYTARLKQSKIGIELHKVRNIRPAFKYGLWCGLAYAALESYILRGKMPWTLRNHADYAQLLPAKNCKIINYPRADGVISFDKMTDLRLSNIKHKDDQPVHLLLKDPNLAVKVNYNIYKAPEQRYCPAGVYEYLSRDGQIYLQINSQNCLHCKACDIKDPKQNITWVPPEGGSGPNYNNL